MGNETEIGLMGKTRGIESAASTPSRQLLPRDHQKFIVDQGYQLIESLLIALMVGAQQACNVAGRRLSGVEVYLIQGNPTLAHRVSIRRCRRDLGELG